MPFAKLYGFGERGVFFRTSLDVFSDRIPECSQGRFKFPERMLFEGLTELAVCRRGDDLDVSMSMVLDPDVRVSLGRSEKNPDVISIKGWRGKNFGRRSLGLIEIDKSFIQ